METLIKMITAAVIFAAISEFFGRSKHIGRLWTFLLTFCGFPIIGFLALVFSPNASKEVRPIKYLSWIGTVIILFVGIPAALQVKTWEFNTFTFEYRLISTSVLTGIYLVLLGMGKVKNSSPKYYFKFQKKNNHEADNNFSATNTLNNQD